MNPSQILDSVKDKLSQATGHFKLELGKVRTGRARPEMLDGLTVEVYGQNMPLKATASVTAPEAQLLQITPFDPTNLGAIGEAIRNDKALGLSPTDDGRVIRINLPPLTSEDRQALVKVIGQKLEECLVSARQIRHEARESAEKEKFSQDEMGRLEKQIDEAMAAQKTEVEALAKAKEQEITTI